MLFGFFGFPASVVDVSLCYPGMGFQAYGIHNTILPFPPAHKGFLALGAVGSCEPHPLMQDRHFVFEIVVTGFGHCIIMGLGGALYLRVE